MVVLLRTLEEAAAHRRGNPAVRRDREAVAPRDSAAVLRPAWEAPVAEASPLLNYKWEKTEQALRRLAQVDASPFDEVILEYVNPTTGVVWPLKLNKDASP